MTQPRPASPRRSGGSSRAQASAGVRVRRLARGADDGYHSPLVPGLKSSQEAERLAEELAFAVARLQRLEHDPPGLYAEVAASTGDIEERTWLAFLIAYLGPLDGEHPFASIEQARTAWRDGELPQLEGVEAGPRGAYDPARGPRTVEAYRAWARRSGSQSAGFAGEPTWTPERRFDRVFERLALPGLHRDARFDLLVTLNRLGIYELKPGKLFLGAGNEVTVAAKRALGIGDPMLLERRAGELANACGIPLAALDVAFFNWERGDRATLGLGNAAEPDAQALEHSQSALGL